MSFKDRSIRITDWTGRDLFIGDYESDEVDKILDANRCTCDDGCDECDQTGYIGDFEVTWVDEENNSCNVYEYINY